MTQQEEEAVRFGEPLPRPYGQEYDWARVANDLRAHPMEWGLVFEVGRVSTVNAIRQGGVRILAPELGFEVRTRRNVREPVRTCQLWMRHNPSREDTLKSAIRQTREV